MGTTPTAFEPDERRRLIAAYVAIVAGLVVMVGIFLPWVRVTELAFRGFGSLSGELRDLAGQGGLSPADLTALTGIPGLEQAALDQHLAYAGRADSTGLLAGLAGFAVMLGGTFAALVATRDARKLGGLIAAVGGALVVAAALTAFLGTERIAKAGLAEEVKRHLNSFLSVPFIGRFLDRMISAVLDAFSVTAKASYGLVLTAAGGALALVAGVLTMREPAPFVHGRTVRGALARTVAGIDPDDRHALLDILTAPADRRDELARSFYEMPGKESWREIVLELEKDERSMQDVVEAIRRIDAG